MFHCVVKPISGIGLAICAIFAWALLAGPMPASGATGHAAVKLAFDLPQSLDCTQSVTTTGTITVRASSSGRLLTGRAVRLYYTFAKGDGSPGNWVYLKTVYTGAQGSAAFTTPAALKTMFVRAVFKGDGYYASKVLDTGQVLVPRPPAIPSASYVLLLMGSRNIEYGASDVRVGSFLLCRSISSKFESGIPFEHVRIDTSEISDDGADLWTTAVTRNSPFGGARTVYTSVVVPGPVTKPITFRAVFAGSPFWKSSTATSTPFAIIAARTKLSTTSNRISVYRGSPVTLSGVVSRYVSGLSVSSGTHISIYAKRQGARTWVKLSTRHTYSGHHWSYSYRPSKRGVWYFQARYAGSGNYLGSTSSNRKISVK